MVERTLIIRNKKNTSANTLQADNRGISTHYLNTSQRYTVAVEPLRAMRVYTGDRLSKESKNGYLPD